MKTRIIQTRFWQDTFIANLTPKNKLLFVYLLTNGRVELTGAYEIPIPYIAMETGLTQAEVTQGLKEIYPKIEYVSGFIVIHNHKKYQDYSKGNDRQRAAFCKEFDRLPDIVKEALNKCILTSQELVNDQSESSQGLDIIYKTENRNKKVEIRKQKTEIEEPEFQNNYGQDLEEIVNHYNEVFDKGVISTKGFEDNFKYWIKIHDTAKIKLAIDNARKDRFWSDKMTLQILFRQKNPRGEKVDYIEEMSNRVVMNQGNIAIL